MRAMTHPDRPPQRDPPAERAPVEKGAAWAVSSWVAGTKAPHTWGKQGAATARLDTAHTVTAQEAG